jgi:hypothetical protein
MSTLNTPTLKTPAHCLLVLMKELHRQQISGEELAGYWYWFCSQDADHWTFLRQGVSFEEGHIYKYEPSPDHPHFKTYNEWKRLTDNDAFDLGELELFSAHSNHISEPDWRPSRWNLTTNPSWKPEVMYEIRKTDKHPDNCKPKLKLIDWSNVPVGTRTNKGAALSVNKNALTTYDDYGNLDRWLASEWRKLRLLPTTKWTALEDDEEPPVVEGLGIEYRYHLSANTPNAVTINAYRVVGLAEGYTDDPSKVGGV